MKDLFWAELRRFRRLSLITAGVHLMLLLFINRTTDLLQLSYYDSTPMLLVYMLAGLTFGCVQIGSYVKPSQWLWLMHRPLSPRRIFVALAASAVVVLACAILLPPLLFLLGTEWFTSKWVDSRHFLLPLYAFAFAFMAWLAGAHACTSRHKAAVAVVFMPLTLALHLVSVWWLLLPVGLALLWLGIIAAQGFRADREAPITGWGTLLLTALPLQLGVFLVLFHLGHMAYITIGMILGTDPLNTPYPPAGGLIEVERAEPKEALILGLAGSRDARAGSWREQLPLLEPVRIGASLQRFPVRHQPANLPAPSQWLDEQRHIEWTFSHDEMRFHGRDPRSGEQRGWWGPQGVGDATAFAAIPQVSEHGENGYAFTQDRLYRIDAEEQRFHELLRLPAGERFLDMPTPGLNRVLVLTNRRLLAYRADRQAVSPYAPLILDWQLPLPGGDAHLESVDIAELMDGWLVSFLYGDGQRQIGFSRFNSVAEPRQQSFFVADDGQASLVAERAIRHDYPAWILLPWWLSPPLHLLSEWPDSALDKGLTRPVEPTWLPKIPVLYSLAGGLMGLSVLLGAWWLRGAPAGRRRFWLASCALLGLPAFVSLLCLEPRAPRRG